MPRLPNFVIIGAPRSGTTSLAHSLSQHPEVFVTMQVKELHFFDTNFDRGLDWYRQQFSGADAAAAKAAGEATPTYMYDETAMSRMAETVPDARLIAILRNPVDRAYSHYWMNRSLDREDLLFPVAIETEAERLAGDDHDEETAQETEARAHQARGTAGRPVRKYADHPDRLARDPEDR
jgi:hypothetical protein